MLELNTGGSNSSGFNVKGSGVYTNNFEGLKEQATYTTVNNTNSFVFHDPFSVIYNRTELNHSSSGKLRAFFCSLYQRLTYLFAVKIVYL